METPLYGFTGNEVLSIGQARLVISLGEEPLRRTQTTNFIVVDAPSAYNVILGRPTLNEFQTVVSTYCQKMKFPVDDQMGKVKGDQLAARRCYVGDGQNRDQSISEDSTAREKEKVQIHPSRLEVMTFVVADLEEEKKAKLIACLKQNHDVFVWSTHELSGISPSVAQHELHVRSDTWPVKQRKRDFSAEHNVIIRAEIEKLLEAGHIREVQFSS
ncbi:uncharacterized protein LOC122007400 [Zingiber officinale]|uniref:uncharacterized protein LOC122007400 n=1 Tax=Zingiber officinale TaxID=94328 RepID=UPI001C4DAF14|nr:uncharacterized protein LOC122007400 [Zingiber officinale]